MAGFVARQPNGLYCRFSTGVACPTDWNMTEEEYIELCAEQAREEARYTLKNHLRPFEWVKDRFYPAEMTEEEFEKILKEMNKPV